MSVTCYAIASKRKSAAICEAFAQGCGGTVVTDGKLRPGTAAFYGVNESNEHIWHAVRATGQSFVWTDNAYYDGAHQRYFRATRNALQCSGLGESDGKRFAALGIEIKPWRKSGQHIVVCRQSDYFMRSVVQSDVDWWPRTRQALGKLTDRPIRVREWDRDKAKQIASLQADLVGAHALITWSSSAAVTALLQGVPVVTLGQSAAAPQATPLEAIENPVMRDDRAQWAAVLADNQYLLDEIRSGYAWEMLQ